MKNALPIITLIAGIVIGYHLPTKQPQLSLEQPKRHYERGQAAIHTRDTLYVNRIETAKAFKERIESAPKDSVMPLRLDSCIQVGMIVLKELESANLAADEFKMAYVQMDSAYTQKVEQLEKEVIVERRWKRIAWGVVVVVAVIGAVG